VYAAAVGSLLMQLYRDAMAFPCNLRKLSQKKTKLHLNLLQHSAQPQTQLPHPLQTKQKNQLKQP
jgi:hypothetical protein